MKTKMSRGSKLFIESLPNKKEKEIFSPFMRDFEMSSVLGEFKDAMLMFPFDVDEKYTEQLERIYNYVRQVVLSKLSQKMLVSSYYKNDKNSQESIGALVERLSGKSDGSAGQTPKKIIFELQKDD